VGLQHDTNNPHPRYFASLKKLSIQQANLSFADRPPEKAEILPFLLAFFMHFL
jgi:hypothetical protein